MVNRRRTSTGFAATAAVKSRRAGSEARDENTAVELWLQAGNALVVIQSRSSLQLLLCSGPALARDRTASRETW